MYVSCEPCMMCMGAILYEEFSKIVYAATLQDSNDNYCPEVISDIDVLAKYSSSEIEIVKELHRDKAVEVLKEAINLIDNYESKLDYEYTEPSKESFYSWVQSDGLRKWFLMNNEEKNLQKTNINW